MEEKWNKVTELLNLVVHKFQKAGFWVLLLILVGMILGSVITSKVYSWKANEAVMLQGVIIDNKIYDLKQRP